MTLVSDFPMQTYDPPVARLTLDCPRMPTVPVRASWADWLDPDTPPNPAPTTPEHKTAARQEWELTDLNTLLRASENPPGFLVEGPMPIPLAETSMMFADGGTGKSALVLQLAVAIVAGKPFLGAKTKQGNVVLLDFENGRWSLGARIRHAADVLGVDPQSLRHTLHVEPLKGRGHLDGLAPQGLTNAVRALQPRLIIVDSWTSAFGADQNDPVAIARSYQVFDAWANTGAAVLLLHHMSKSDVASNRPRPGGNAALYNRSRVAFHLGCTKTGRYTITAVKENLGISRVSSPIRVTKLPGGLWFEGPETGTMVVNLGGTTKESNDEKLVLNFVRDSGGTATEAAVFKHAREVVPKGGRRKDIKTVRRSFGPVIDGLVGRGRLARGEMIGKTYPLVLVDAD